MTTSTPTATAPPTAAVRGTTTGRALRRMVATEARLFLRDPAAAFFTLAFPVLLLVILGCVPGFRTATPKLGGLSTVEVYAPIMVVFTLTMLAMNGLAPVLTAYREKGVLRRLSASPVPAALVLGALVVLYLAVAVVSLLMVVVVGRLAFGVPLPRQLAAFLVAFVFAAASLFAVGLLIAAVAPSAKAGQAIGTALFFPLEFFSGLWVPRQTMPSVLRHIGDFLPTGSATQAVQDAWRGDWPHVGDLTTMAVFTLVAGVVAAKLFRWE
ncbi:ABC transporter permease [Streptantibioticus parmotrematis]|uniref:ABC transporter permease n=1 Tax=Streptantibioticus parmotrematis TaxID=2873249 RepID=UPI0033C9A880